LDPGSILGISTNLKNLRKPYINNQIRAEEVRLIDEEGNQLGLLGLEKAIDMAKEKGLDLIQVTEKVNPPVCKIMDYGKYLYRQKKKDKTTHQHKGGEIKGIRLTFKISDHDMETRAKQAEKFLKKGDKIMVEMKLRGREKALGRFAEERINQFVKTLNNLIPIKVERELRRQPRGLTMIIAKQ